MTITQNFKIINSKEATLKIMCRFRKIIKNWNHEKIDPIYNQSSCLTVLILDSMSYSHSLLKHFYSTFMKNWSTHSCFLNPIAYHLMCHGPVCLSWPVLPDLYLNIIARTTTKTDRHKHLETGKECCMVWHSTDEIPLILPGVHTKNMEILQIFSPVRKIFLIGSCPKNMMTLTMCYFISYWFFKLNPDLAVMD